MHKNLTLNQQKINHGLGIFISCVYNVKLSVSETIATLEYSCSNNSIVNSQVWLRYPIFPILLS